MAGTRAFLWLAVAFASAAGCGSKGHAKVDGVLIPQADGVVKAAKGSTLAVDVDTVADAEIPDGDVVRLAIGRKVPWNRVKALVEQVESAGKEPVLLVGDYHKVKGFEIEDDWPAPDAPAIQVIAYVDGKACVQPPGAFEAKCVQSGDKSYIDRAFLREIIREQVRMFDMPRVEVELAGTLHWSDAVTTIDASRTCCFEDKVLVRLKRPEPESSESESEP